MKIGILANSFLIFSILVACPATALGDDSHAHHKAHNHGVAQLGVVNEGNELSIVFTSPASDLVGFEHAASSNEELAALSKLEGTLKESAGLFILPTSARCSLNKHTVEHALRETSQNMERHVHNHRADADHEIDNHKEITAQYRYLCEDTEELTTIEVALFQKFPSLKTIITSVLAPSYQGRQELSSRNSTVLLN